MRRGSSKTGLVQQLRARKVGLRALVTFGVIAATAVVLAPSSGAKPPSSDVKRYDACLQNDAGSPACSTSGQPTVLVGGSTSQMKLTITNEAVSNTTLGSANITGPSALAIDPASVQFSSGSGTLGTNTATAIQLRDLNLAPGASVSVTFNVTAPCSGSGFTWQIAAKQSNRFQGTGNDFQLITTTGFTTNIAAGPCFHLEFINQPTPTVVGQTITDAPISSGGAIRVGLYDSSEHLITTCPDPNPANCNVTMSVNEPALGTLGGTLTRSLVGGVATFDNLSITGAGAAGHNFTLHAAALGTAVDSNPFLISATGSNCLGVDPCVLSTQGDNSLIDESATGGAFTFIALNQSVIPASVTDPNNPNAGCRYFVSTGAGGFEEIDGRTGAGEMHFTYDVPIRLIKKRFPNYGQPQIPLCAGAKRVVNNQPVNCNPDAQPGDPDGPWLGKALGTDGKLNGALRYAVCGEGGYWWAVLGSFQDPIDPALNPTVTGWSSATIGGIDYRQFFIRVPTGWDWKNYG